jgi:hypothetical protein
MSHPISRNAADIPEGTLSDKAPSAGVDAAVLLAPAVKTLPRDPGIPACDLGRFVLIHRDLNLAKQCNNLAPL